MTPKTAYPAAQIAAVGASIVMNSSSSVVMALPNSVAGVKAQYIRLSCVPVASSANVSFGYVRLSPTATSATATTADTVVTANESLWLATLGMSAIACLGGPNLARMQVSPLEEGVIIPSAGLTPGLG